MAMVRYWNDTSASRLERGHPSEYSYSTKINGTLVYILIRYFTDILEMLQGVWVFAAFVVFNQSARQEFWGGKKIATKQEEQGGLLDDTDHAKVTYTAQTTVEE